MKIEISPDYQYMAKELFDIPRMFDEEQGEIVYSGRNFVRRFIIQGTPVVGSCLKSRSQAVHRISPVPA